MAIRPAPGNVLMMETMIFADEVVRPDDIDDLPEAKELKASERELEMAQQLIDSLSSDFEPGKYQDEYREKVLELIERKASGEEIAVQPEAPQPSKVPDLMAALEASLAAVKGDSPRATARRRRSRRSPAAKARGEEQHARPGRYAASRSSSNQTRRLRRPCSTPQRSESSRTRYRPQPDGRAGPASGSVISKPRPGSQTSIRSARSPVDDDQLDHVGLLEPGVADRVGDELGDEQLRVLEPPRRELVGDLAERAPGLRGGVGIARELDLVPHLRPRHLAADRRRSRAAPASALCRTPASLVPRRGTSANRRPSSRARCVGDRDDPQAAGVHELTPRRSITTASAPVRVQAGQLVSSDGRRPRCRARRQGDHGGPAGAEVSTPRWRHYRGSLGAAASGRTRTCPSLRRADCSGPGIRRKRHGSGFSYVDDDGRADRRARRARADRRAGDPARVGGRLDLPLPERPPAGDGHRRRRAQAVPLPRRLARAARPREVRRHGALRPRAAAAARARRRRPGRLRRLDRACVLACAVRLLERGFFRIGSEEYAVENASYGLATMRKDARDDRATAA